MNRTNIYLTDEQRRRLDARARAEGVSRAEQDMCGGSTFVDTAYLHTLRRQ